jgi:asparagine synthase (glutamine-hydrolysing)
MISPPAALRFDRGEPSEERWRLLFDGRLDNREELERELGVRSCTDATDAADATDADIVLRFLAAGRWEALDRFLGPWALVLFDLHAREAHLARDPTGERTLCWHADPRRLLVAGEPAALLADPDVPGDLDEETLASFFAVREPAADATFFRAIRQVPPGHRIVLSAAGERRHRFWNPDLSLLPLGEAHTIERFRELLGAAVRAQLRGSSGPAAVLLSGGLDSTTVAAHAARISREQGQPPVRAVSWRFHELAAADESAYAQAMMTAAGLEPVWVDGDGCWPLRDLDPDLETFGVDPSQPFENPYRELHAAAFSAAAAAGSRVLLTGHFSDEMYHGVDAWWLRDCLARGAWSAAAEGLRDEIRWRSRPDVWTPGLRRTLGVLLLGTGWERLRARRIPEWLTPYGRERLRSLPAPLRLHARHPEQAETLLAPFALMGIAAETRRARQQGIELRFPFRDRRLLEFALRVPADHLARPGWRKRLIWLAGEGWLPDAVRLRRQRSNLGPLFVRGLERENGAARRLLFGEGPQLWRRWVEAGLLERFLDVAGPMGLPAQVFWHCLIAEMWARSLP